MALRRLPRVLTVVTLGSVGCSAPSWVEDAGTDAGTLDSGRFDAGTTDAGTDAGASDAGPTDAGPTDAGPTDAGPADAGTDGGLGDGGCMLPSDFPPDASAGLINAACSCPQPSMVIRCHEEGGPRCFSWACYPAKSQDGGYRYNADGGLSCLC